MALGTAAVGILLMVLGFWVWGDALLPYRFGFNGLRSWSHELLRIMLIPAHMATFFLNGAFDIHLPEHERAFGVYAIMLGCQGILFFGVGMVASIFYRALRDRRMSGPRDVSPETPPPRHGFWSGRLVWGMVLAVLVIACWAGAVTVTRRVDDSVYVASCANHFIQDSSVLNRAAEKNPDFMLPATSDTRAALWAVSKSLGDNSYGEEWLNGYGSACPESYWRDNSVGYVYIGDGLRLGDVKERRILILFCPAENHRGSQEHCHGWCVPDAYICVKTNAAMIEALQGAIARGESGDVSYSPRAMKVLREELRKRRE